MDDRTYLLFLIKILDKVSANQQGGLGLFPQITSLFEKRLDLPPVIMFLRAVVGRI